MSPLAGIRDKFAKNKKAIRKKPSTLAMMGGVYSTAQIGTAHSWLQLPFLCDRVKVDPKRRIYTCMKYSPGDVTAHARVICCR